MTAAPGPQQPDEVVSRDDALVFLSTLYGRGHAYPRPGQTRQEMSEESVALVRRFVADHTPAAPSAQPDPRPRGGTVTTSFVETDALLAALHEDEAELIQILGDMTISELTALRTAVQDVDRAALTRIGELQRQSWGI